jgi:hypothetical protein
LPFKIHNSATNETDSHDISKIFLKVALGHSGRRGRGRMVVEFTTTYAIGAYHH